MEKWHFTVLGDKSGNIMRGRKRKFLGKEEIEERKRRRGEEESRNMQLDPAMKALMLKDEIPSYDKEAMDTEHDKEDVKEEDTAITHQDHDIAHQDIAVMSQDEMSEDEKGEKQKLLDASSGK